MTLLDGRRRVWGSRVRGFLDYSVRFDHVSFLCTCVRLLYVLLPLLCLYCAVLDDLSCRGMVVVASTDNNPPFVHVLRSDAAQGP